MVRNAPVIVTDVPEIAVVAVVTKVSSNQGNFFLQYFPNMCKSGSPSGEPLLFVFHLAKSDTWPSICQLF